MTGSDRSVAHNAFAAILVTVFFTMTAGCSHLPRPHWPWQGKQAPAPEEVHELVVTAPEGSSVTVRQYWQGNTLIVDLRSGGGTGSTTLKPREHTLWPARIAFRVMPGQFATLEVRAYQRVVLPITAVGAQPVDLELAPGVYLTKTAEITVLWGPGIQPSGS
jgi:hypothetical protein